MAMPEGRFRDERVVGIRQGLPADDGWFGRRKAISDSLMSRENPEPLTEEMVLELDKRFRLGGGHKVIFDTSMVNLVREGFLFTSEMYRTATFGPVAEEAASTLLRLCDLFIPGKERYVGIEGCTGAGSQTFALAGFDGELWIEATVELDPVVALFTKKNLERLVLDGLGNILVIADVSAYLEAQFLANNGRGKQHDWVIVDPDWHGKHYQESEHFDFGSMSPNGGDLVRSAMKVAKIVGIKAPGKMEDREIQKLADELDAHVYVRDIGLSVGDECIKERIVFFIEKDLINSELMDNGNRMFVVEHVDLEINMEEL